MPRIKLVPQTQGVHVLGGSASFNDVRSIRYYALIEQII